MLAGFVDPVGRIVTRFTKEMGGNPEATVVGASFKTSAPQAAFANGTMAHALDFDDMSFPGHPSSSVLPVLMALGERQGSSGKELMEAHAVGFETFGRLASVSPGGIVWERGWHPTALFGIMGATAAAAKLLKLDVDQTRVAFGISGSAAAGAKPNVGTMAKPLHPGNAARSAIVSALLAKEGLTAERSIFEHPLGFAHAYFGDEGYRIEEMTKDLGDSFRIIKAGPSIKKYPCCGQNHRALDAVLSLIHEYNIRYEDVETVQVERGPREKLVLAYSEPKTGYEGKYSIEYNMAAAILDGKITRDTYTDAKANSPAMKEALKKIKLIDHPEWGLAHPGSIKGRGNPVTVTLKDGREYNRKIVKPKGHPDEPLAMEEFLAKYRENARLVLSSQAMERSIELMLDLENLEGIGDLMQLVSEGASTTR